MTTIDTRLSEANGDLKKRRQILKCLVPIQRRVAMLMGLWLKELFWGSGRFDADPHKGNVIVPTCYEMTENTKPFIALIDFGSYGQLDRRSQCIVFQTLISGERVVQFKKCMPAVLTPASKEKPSLSDARIKQLKGLQDLLKYFPSFDTLSARNQLDLFACVDRQLHADPRVHDINIEHVRSVIRNIWKICNVKEDPKETEKMVELCFDYEKEIDFGSCFLKVAQNATTIGTCSSSSVLMYGRGLAYLDQMWRMTREKCTEIEDNLTQDARTQNDLARYLTIGVEKCNRGKLISLIWKNFFTHPGLGARYLTNCWFA
jgi:hypothetical protein